MIKWIKVFFLGVFIWFLLTFLYGFSIGILDLDTSGSFENNLILLPVGIYLGFKIIEYKENKSLKNDKSYKDHIDKTSKGVEEELSKAKSNKSTNPIENQLVSDQHLGMLAWTVASWRLTVENSTNKMMLEKKAVKFCRLFLAQEKKRKKINDYNRADVRILYTLSLSCPLADVDKLIAKNGWTLEVGHQFEKEIGYKS
jgi:hypothetical protein